MNLFFSIISRLQEKDSNVVRFSFEQLKDLRGSVAKFSNQLILR